MKTETQVLKYSPEILNSIIESIEGQTAKNVIQEIVKHFDAKGFIIKVQHIIRDDNEYYRVLCFIKNSKETVNINTKNKGLDIKIRIENQNTFGKLDEFTENIRNQILNGYDCHYCGTGCEGKKYIFTFHGNEYVKCQYLGCNFRFRKIDESDIASMMDIIDGEFAHKQTQRN